MGDCFCTVLGSNGKEDLWIFDYFHLIIVDEKIHMLDSYSRFSLNFIVVSSNNDAIYYSFFFQKSFLPKISLYLLLGYLKAPFDIKYRIKIPCSEGGMVLTFLLLCHGQIYAMCWTLGTLLLITLLPSPVQIDLLCQCLKNKKRKKC